MFLQQIHPGLDIDRLHSGRIGGRCLLAARLSPGSLFPAGLVVVVNQPDVIFVLSLFDILTLGFFGEAGSQVGIVVLTLTLSLALADRISIYRREKESGSARTAAQTRRVC